jgi:hypothetical protein
MFVRIPSPLCAFLLLAACAAEKPHALLTRHSFYHDALGIGFDLPVHWTYHSQASSRGSVLVFSGPNHTNQYYTTVTLQAVTSPQESLYQALLTVHESILGLPEFAWIAREPAVIDGRPALRYALCVQLHESLRLKYGVLLEASGYLVNLTYSGTTEVFGDAVGVFEDIVASLSVTDIAGAHVVP